MVNVYLILGNRNVRKSATIRALTGTSGRERIRELDIAIVNGIIIKVYVQVRSLQEADMHQGEFIEKVGSSPNVLVPLWISGNRNQEGAGFFIEAFHQAGWNISHVVVLGTNELDEDILAMLPEPLYFPNSTEMPANQIASEIRRIWNWL